MLRELRFESGIILRKFVDVSAHMIAKLCDLILSW